jgi:hypothetical protein
MELLQLYITIYQRLQMAKKKLTIFWPTPFFQYDNNNSTSNTDTLFVPALDDTVAKEYLRFLNAIKDKRRPPFLYLRRTF